MVDVPTFIVGATQSGKSYHAARLFRSHPGPALYADLQWVTASYLARDGSYITEDLDDAVDALNGGRVVWRPDSYGRLGELIDYLHTLHRDRHREGSDLPLLALFLDEITLAADNTAKPDNPAVRLFTQCYGHRIVGVAITQRASQTSRHILGNTYDKVIFSLDPADVLTLHSSYGLDVPDPEWTRDPRDHHYFVYRSGSGWWRGDDGGVEVEVSQVRPPDADALSEPTGPGDGGADDAEEPARLVPDVQSGQGAGGTRNPTPPPA